MGNRSKRVLVPSMTSSREVGGDRKRRTASFDYRLHRAADAAGEDMVSLVDGAGRHSHCRALRREPLGDRLTDASAGPGDDRHLAFKRQFDALPLGATFLVANPGSSQSRCTGTNLRGSGFLSDLRNSECLDVCESPRKESMAIVIVQGVFSLEAEERDRFVEASIEGMRSSRKEEGCLEYVVAADPLDQERAILSERWDSMEHLNRHLAQQRQAASGAGNRPAPRSIEITLFEVASSRPLR